MLKQSCSSFSSVIFDLDIEDYELLTHRKILFHSKANTHTHTRMKSMSKEKRSSQLSNTGYCYITFVLNSFDLKIINAFRQSFLA